MTKLIISKFLEVSGVLLLLLIITALLTAGAYLFWPIESITDAASLLALIGAIVAMTNSIFRFFGVVNTNRDLTLGYIFLAIGSVIVFFTPSFFYDAFSKGIENEWLLLSYYSLPVIMIEGGLFSMWIWFSEKRGNKKLCRLEKALPIIAAIYFIGIIGYSIGVVFYGFSIYKYIFIARTALIVLAIVTIVYTLKKKK